MAALRLIPVLLTALLLSACASPGGTVAVVAAGNLTRNNAPTLSAAVRTVGIPKHSASTGGSSLSSIPPVLVQLLPFNDDRADQDTEGTATAAFGVPMGRIRFDPSPATLLGQVVRTEIAVAGHTVRDDTQGTQITGSVRAFEAHTETSLLYWDVIGNLAVSLNIAVARGTGPQTRLDYQARCTDRTYVWPSQAVIAGVMRRCIGDFSNTLRSDGRAARGRRPLRENQQRAGRRGSPQLRPCRRRFPG